MTCIKTGAHAYLEEYNEWAYGDAFHFIAEPHIHDKVVFYAFRFVMRELVPIYKVKHFTIITVLADWRDGSMNTVLASNVTNHGYEGIPV